MKSARLHSTMTVLPSGEVLVIGGYTTVSVSSRIRNVDIYDPTTNTWTEAAPMTFARGEHTPPCFRRGRCSGAGGHLGSALLYTP